MLLTLLEVWNWPFAWKNGCRGELGVMVAPVLLLNRDWPLYDEVKTGDEGMMASQNAHMRSTLEWCMKLFRR